MLIEEVAKGRQIIITDRGRAVAMLVPPILARRSGFPDLATIRRRNLMLSPLLSGTIEDERDDRF